MKYFTSDWHIGSNNINKYANRPFISAKDAAERIIDNCNNTAKYRSDVVFHVGDFYLKNSDRHDSIEDINTLTAKAEDYISFVNSRFVLLEGNHDKNNIESDMKSMVLDLNQNWRNVSVGHYPSYSREYSGWIGSEHHPHIHLCGHVHDKFFIKWDEKKYVLNYNVGVDCHDFKPVRDAEITADLDYLWNAKVKFPFEMTRDQFEEWKKKNDAFVEAERKRRKENKYKKKGLTPEICQQRKEEAMRKKGLIE